MVRRIAMTLLGLFLLSSCARTTSTPTGRPEQESTPVPSLPSATTVGSGADSLSLSVHDGNPVLSPGEPDAWDSAAVFNAHIVLDEGRYHMFYNGADAAEGRVAIGYAASDDGRRFTKEASNPILDGDEQGFDAIQVSDGVAVVEAGTWVLYYNAGVGQGPGRAIGRASAPSPTGRWSRRAEPVLRSGEFGAWDGGFVTPQSVVQTDDGYVMYYMAGPGQQGEPAWAGMATSSDGTSWTKHDDPDTSEPPFAESDPVLRTGPADSWDSESIWGCSVVKSGDTWEMFYAASRSGVVKIGHATSADGIEWTRYEQNPVLAPEDDPGQAERESNILESPTCLVSKSNYFLYYDYGLQAGGVGLATRVAREQ